MSTSLWSLALALLQQTAPPPEAPASLRELVATSELIAWVRVVDVRAIDLGDAPLLRYVWPHGDVPYMDLAVESVVFGDGEPAALLAFAGDVAAPGGGTTLAVGERALVFLERDTRLHWRLSDCETRWVREYVAGRRSWAVRPGGLWRVADDGERLQRPPLAPPLDSTAGGDVGREPLLAQIDLALDLELPRFEAKLVSNGARPFQIAIPGDGRLRGTVEGAIEPSQLRLLWEAVERERFGELPALVGRSGAPCLTAMELCVVTRRSRRTVGFELGGIDGLPDGELREATRRALRVWEAVPVPERPVLR